MCTLKWRNSLVSWVCKTPQARDVCVPDRPWVGIHEWDGHVWTSASFSVVLHASIMYVCLSVLAAACMFCISRQLQMAHLLAQKKIKTTILTPSPAETVSLYWPTAQNTHMHTQNVRCRWGWGLSASFPGQSDDPMCFCKVFCSLVAVSALQHCTQRGMMAFLAGWGERSRGGH